MPVNSPFGTKKHVKRSGRERRGGGGGGGGGRKGGGRGGGGGGGNYEVGGNMQLLGS